MENKNYQSKFYWAYLAGFFLILSLPLWATPLLFYPPAWGKTIVFKIILSILIFLFIYQIIYRKNTPILEKLKSKPVKLVLGILILLLFLFLLSTIFSVNQYFSFWGISNKAGGGFLNFSLYLIFALLIFLILKLKHWEKIWNFSIIVGIFVALIAVLQQFNILKEFLISYEVRPPSTIGSPIILAFYLLLLIFLTLSFGIKEKKTIMRRFYFGAFLLFFLVIIFTGTRAAYVGLGTGILFFILFYPVPEPPQKNKLSTGQEVRYGAGPKKLTFLKLAILIFLALGILGVYYLNTHSKEIFSQPFVAKNQVLTTLLSKFNVKVLLQDPRFVYWKMILPAIKEKPLWGYGPENFSVAFDKYYDPSLPFIGYEIAESWEDRAHGFILDTAVTAGIPALIIYLSLFGVLFWQLQKIKNPHKSEEISINQRPIIVHGVQTTIIAYFMGILFSFDIFDTYLIFFLLVGYCLYLVSSSSANISGNPPSSAEIQNNQNKNNPLKSVLSISICVLLFCVTTWFIWQYNIKPLFINKEINQAIFYSQNQKCEKAFATMEKILPSHSFIDFYLRSQYVDIIGQCLKANPQLKTELSLKAIQILDETIKLKPEYTRSWLFLGSYINLFVEDNEKIDQSLKKEFLKKADYSFKQASELSPKRQEIYVGWFNTDMISGKYAEAKQKAEKCISLYSELGECWWIRGLSNLLLGNPKQFEQDIKIAGQKEFNINAKGSLLQLLKVYSILIQSSDGNKTEYYLPLVDIYQKLIVLNPESFQYHASLAYVYKMLGEYKKAREEALIALELSPESKQSVEEFLKTLP